MVIQNKATKIDWFQFRTPPMRAFHLTWFAFFLCFFGWFGIAPLMVVVREDLGLTKEQIGNTIIASVAITIFIRLLIGPLCDRFGPRLVYTWLLLVGSLPVMGIGLAYDYTSFLLFRLAIGAIGASFVITQYHTTIMFAPNCVGTATATTAGWGNMGGGVTQMVMPALLMGLVGLGLSETVGWRVAMIVPGAAMLFTGIAYYLWTQDAPDGNFAQLRANNPVDHKNDGISTSAAFGLACRDPRVWALFVVYAGCFGVELIFESVAALYYHDHFGLSLQAAGLFASLFGLMSLFARTLGGYCSDMVARRFGLAGRVHLLFVVILLEGIGLAIFSQMTVLWMAVAAQIFFSLFVKMAEGATYGVVPFLHKKALGMVAGIVAAGGNVGAVLAGFLFRAEHISTNTAFLYLGFAVVFASGFVWLVRFDAAVEASEGAALQAALAEREAQRLAEQAAMAPAT